jgi:hypothetical protein
MNNPVYDKAQLKHYSDKYIINLIMTREQIWLNMYMNHFRSVRCLEAFVRENVYTRNEFSIN